MVLKLEKHLLCGFWKNPKIGEGFWKMILWYFGMFLGGLNTYLGCHWRFLKSILKIFSQGLSFVKIAHKWGFVKLFLIQSDMVFVNLLWIGWIYPTSIRLMVLELNLGNVSRHFGKTPK